MADDVPADVGPTEATPRAKVTELALLFLRLGFTAFGGPAAHIAIMENEVVRRRRWLSSERFLDLLGAANLIPGPSSTELAIFIGYEQAGWLGLVLAGVCFILPAAVMVAALAWTYVQFDSLPQVAGILYGIKPVVIAVVVQALSGLAPKAIKKSFWLGALGVVACVASALHVDALVVLVAAGVASVAQRRIGKADGAMRAVLFGGFASSTVAVAAPVSLLALFLSFLKIGTVVAARICVPRRGERRGARFDGGRHSPARACGPRGRDHNRCRCRERRSAHPVPGEHDMARRWWGLRRRSCTRSSMKRLGFLGLAASLIASTASAGPPYTTDDPEPVEYRHWEVYLASQSFHDKDGWTGTAPHVEVNYGAVPNVQLHVIAPLAYSIPYNGPSAFGYGDTELGIKLRFLQERKWTPMIGTFPFLEVPSGSRSSGLGNGSAQAFIPVWLQKSFGPWQTYGGVGVWLDLGDSNRHWWYLGWQAQRRMFEWLTVGAEVFHQTPEEHGGEGDSRFNVGMVLDFTQVHHLLLSGGRGFEGSNLFQGYVAYQATFGPPEALPR